MGEEQSKIQQRQQPALDLEQKIQNCLSDQRLKLSHQTNIWKLCRRLRENYSKWQITEIHLDNNMIAGEVIQEITKINFEKSQPPLKLLALSQNDIICDNIKYFRNACFNSLLMIYLDHNKIASDGCFYISKTLFTKLQTLDLSYNLINQNGAGHLATSNLPNLFNLIITNNRLTQRSLYILSQAHWPTLAFLQAKDNNFEPTKQMELIKFRTEVKMFRLQIQ